MNCELCIFAKCARARVSQDVVGWEVRNRLIPCCLIPDSDTRLYDTRSYDIRFLYQDLIIEILENRRSVLASERISGPQIAAELRVTLTLKLPEFFVALGKEALGAFSRGKNNHIAPPPGRAAPADCLISDCVISDGLIPNCLIQDCLHFVWQ